MTLTDYGYTPEPFALLFIMFVLLFSVVAILAIIIYVIKALALYELSKTLKLKNDWFGFVPFLRNISCGNIASGKEKSRLGYVLVLFSVFCFVFSIAFLCIFGSCFINLIFEADSAMLEGLSQLPREALNSFNSAIISAVIMCVFAIIYKILRIISEFKIYKKFAPSYALLYVILGIILPFLTPFFLFSIRKNTSYQKTEQSRFDFE